MKKIQSARLPDAVYSTKSSLVSARETLDVARHGVQLWADKVLDTDMVFMRSKDGIEAHSWPLSCVTDIVWAAEEAAKPAVSKAAAKPAA